MVKLSIVKLLAIMEDVVEIDRGRDFCKDPLWDDNVTWFTDEPDFTQCFHSTVLIYAPALLLWLGIPFEWLSWKATMGRGVPWTPLNLARLAGMAGLILVSVIQLIFELVYLGAMRPTANILSPVVILLTVSLSAVLSFEGRKRGQTSSGIQFCFWAFLACGATLTFTSYVRFPEKYFSGEQALFYIYYALVAAEFFLHCWSDPPPNYIDFRGKKKYTFTDIFMTGRDFRSCRQSFAGAKCFFPEQVGLWLVRHDYQEGLEKPVARRRPLRPQSVLDKQKSHVNLELLLEKAG